MYTLLFYVQQIKAGGCHTVVLLSDGTAKAWGHNGYGQLGDGTIIDRLIPTEVQGLN